jgi:hypothetical protein
MHFAAELLLGVAIRRVEHRTVPAACGSGMPRAQASIHPLGPFHLRGGLSPTRVESPPR